VEIGDLGTRLRTWDAIGPDGLMGQSPPPTKAIADLTRGVIYRFGDPGEPTTAIRDRRTADGVPGNGGTRNDNAYIDNITRNNIALRRTVFEAILIPSYNCDLMNVDANLSCSVSILASCLITRA